MGKAGAEGFDFGVGGFFFGDLCGGHVGGAAAGEVDVDVVEGDAGDGVSGDAGDEDAGGGHELGFGGGFGVDVFEDDIFEGADLLFFFAFSEDVKAGA